MKRSNCSSSTSRTLIFFTDFERNKTRFFTLNDLVFHKFYMKKIIFVKNSNQSASFGSLVHPLDARRASKRFQLRCTGFYWLLPPYDSVLLSCVEFYRVLLGFLGIYWVFTSFHMVLLGFTRFHCVLLGFHGFYGTLLCFTGFEPSST